MLGGLIHLCDGFAHLPHPQTLLFAGRADFSNQIRDMAHGHYQLIHGRAGLRHQMAALLHAGHALTNQLLDFLGGIRTAACQGSHLTRYHGKAAPLLAGAGGFYRRVQRQDVGLKGNRVNHADDVGNPVAAGINFLHGGHHLGHHLTAPLCHLRGIACQLVGLRSTVSVVAYRGSHLLHRGRRLLQCAGLLFGSARQVGIAQCNLLARAGNTICIAAHIRHHMLQAVAHGGQLLQQSAHFIVATGRNVLRQIALGNAACRAHGLIGRHRHGTGNQPAQYRSAQRAQGHASQHPDGGKVKAACGGFFCSAGLCLAEVGQSHQPLQQLHKQRLCRTHVEIGDLIAQHQVGFLLAVILVQRQL